MSTFSGNISSDFIFGTIISSSSFISAIFHHFSVSNKYSSGNFSGLFIRFNISFQTYSSKISHGNSIFQ
ncbi:hypothetical protein H3C61_00440 [Candidatus Gracilibacteria bacterium]|nr:hypothetical protein [Candidatus Gracilibacteria bacterium]